MADPALPAEQPPVPGGETPTLAQETPPAPADGKRPEPVLNAAKIAGAVSGVILAVGGLLRLFAPLLPASIQGLDVEGIALQASNAILAIGGAWALMGPYFMAWIKARNKVTPLSDPRDAAGNRLTPEGT